VEVRVKDKEPVKLRAAANTAKFDTKMPEVTEYVVAATAEGFLPKEQKFTVPVLQKDTTVSIEVALRPVAKKLILTGTVFDKKTDQQIAGAKVGIVFKRDRKVNYNVTAEKGSYEKEIPKTGWYILTASAEGYLNVTDSVQAESEEISPVTKDLYLDPIEIGLTVRLKNIYFDFDRTTLKKESFTELNKVVDFLKQNASVEIEIAGHTDNKGADDYNANLSQGRSQAVVDYLISQGIADSRLTAHGYGESKPIDSNDTDAGRANNRRVEFTVVKK